MAAGGSPGRPLWRDRNFGIFWVAQSVSVAGDSFAYIAIPLLVLHATGSVAQMGLLTGAGGAASVGAAVLAWAAGRYGVGPVCAASGAGCLLIAAVALFTPIRQPAPELASDTALPAWPLHILFRSYRRDWGQCGPWRRAGMWW